MKHYDLVIVGAGSGNSMIVPEMDTWRIAMVEKGVFGGTCLNVGCIPTKMFVHAADVALDASDNERFGVTTQFQSADWPSIRDRVFGRIDPIAAGGERYRKSLDNVDVYQGTGSFTGVREMTVGDDRFTADRFVLANGARSRVVSIPGLDEVPFHTSDTVMRLDQLPRHLVILGGGFIASEFAHVFGSLGSKVTIVNRSHALLMAEDDEISARFTAELAKRFDVVLGAKITRAFREDGEEEAVGVEIETATGTRRIVGDVLLVATGRVPNGDNLNPAATGLELGPMGEIPVDEYGRTAVPGIWAIGDVNGRHQLKHMANGEARIVTHNLLHPDHLQAFERRPAPHAVFSHPQVAGVGLTESQAAQLNDAVVITHDYAGAAWGWALEDTTSFIKLIGDPTTGRLLGAHALGPQASTLVSLLVQGMYLDNTVEQMAKDVVYIHPAPSEVVEQALLKLLDAFAASATPSNA